MESEAIDWEQDLPLDADEAYRSLVRSLRRTDGFALLFVCCSPVQGDRIITAVRADLPSKTIEVLELKESIDNLYDHVDALPNCDQINVLFIKGIEHSIFAYEDREMNDINLRSQSSLYGGTWKGVPRVLGNLNLSRERFRDNFKFCFVFLLREFTFRYFIRRAPDFFDWRSGVVNIPEPVLFDYGEVYQSLVQSLRHTDGFSLLFVRCSPVKGDQIITDIRNDLPSKTIEVLELKESIDNLYDHVATLPNCDQINVLFIKGIEHSIFAYEDREMNDINLRSQSSLYGGTWKDAPRVLENLNLSRECFRDNFKFCFVFLLREFALRYFIRCVPNFFDWRSGVIDMSETVPFAHLPASAGLRGEYRDFVTKILSRNSSYIFVRCSPETAKRLIKKVLVDISDIQINVLDLEYPIENLIDIIKSIPNQSALKVLFISGLEKSLTYQDYNESNTIPLLRHLNQQHDNFLKTFPNLCFVFLLPLYAINYIERDAPDFYRLVEKDISYFQTDSSIFTNELNKDSIPLPDSRIELQSYSAMTKIDREAQLQEIEKLIDNLSQSDDQKSKLYFDRGLIYLVNKEYEEAIDSFKKAMHIRPDDHLAWFNMGYAFRKLGINDEAISSYDEVLKLKPDYYLAWNHRGWVLRKLGKYEESIESYDRGLEINPNDYLGWYNRGYALRKLGKYEEAIASFNKVLKLKPDYYEALYNQAICLSYLEKHEDAINSYNKAVALKPNYHLAWYNLGSALGTLDRHEEAIAAYDKTLEIKSSDYLAWYNRGSALGKLGRFEQSIISYDKALQSKPNYYLAWYNRGIALRQLGRYEEALSSYEKAVEIKPDYYEAWYNQGFVLLSLSRYEEAIYSYHKALQVNPNSHKSYYNLACAYSLQNNIDLALNNLQKAIEISPEENRKFATTDPDFDNIRHDPRFQALIQ
jgi:tetratricopeptide (TPR) repeat protein